MHSNDVLDGIATLVNPVLLHLEELSYMNSPLLAIAG